jgi:biotin transporter BioY
MACLNGGFDPLLISTDTSHAAYRAVCGTQAGFLFPVCWLVCVFLPCCSKHNSPRDKRAATASGVMIAAVVVIVVMKCGLGWNEGAMRRSEYVYYT